MADAMNQMTEKLYEELADAIDQARDGLDVSKAAAAESQFLAKLAFLSLRHIGNLEAGRDLIACAQRNLEHSLRKDIS